MLIGRLLFVVLVLCCVTVGSAQQPSRLPFLAVQPSDDYKLADQKLTDELNRNLPVGLTSIDRPRNFSEYSDLITDVVARNDAFVARMTPYAYVAARMLGARVDAIGTYLRKDDTASDRSFVSTYRSYFVVRASQFNQSGPTLEDIFQFVKDSAASGRPARFTYTQQFSTSGFFVPALWMRNRHIFATDEDSSGIVRISSYALRGFDDVISAVEEGGADFAAVWDKDKTEYESTHAEGGVRFIPLPWVLPNDLLVCSRGVDAKTRATIGEALAKAREIDVGDFHSWKRIQESEASDALRAVAELERVAAASPAPVVVDIQPAPTAEAYLDEARQAVRLAGTEFVLFDRYFHAEADIVWKLEKVHEGSLTLTTDITETSLKTANQRFQISFTNAEGDLATRIVALIHSRMHRIRYVWPYEHQSPTVIRDIDVSIPAGTSLMAQQIVWTDPDRNEFRHGRTTPLIVQPQSNAYKFTLTGGIAGFDNPLSNVGYRVVLERRSNESRAARVLTVTLLGLMGLTAVGLVLDLRHKAKPAPLARRTLRDVCSTLASKTHERWRGYTLKDAELITCERPRLEELIEELKGRGLVTAKTAGVTKWVYEVSGSLSIPIVRGILGGGLQSSRRVELTASPDKFGDTARLSALIDLLVEKRLLSLFVGRPLEWDALNELASGILTPTSQPLRLERLVRAEDTTVIDLASQHFNQVLDDALKRVSLLAGTWTIMPTDRETLMRQRVVLDGPLWVGQERKEVSSLTLEFHLPADKLTVASGEVDYDCWLLGKVVRLTYVEPHELCVHFRTLAAIAAEGVAPVTEGRVHGLLQGV